MSYLIKDWLKAVSPVIKFKDPSINTQGIIDKYYNENKKFPPNEIIGTATLLSHNNTFHVVTNYHVLKATNDLIGLALRVGPQILFYFYSDVLNQIEAEWIIDEANDLALSVFIVPDIKPFKFKTIPTNMFCPKSELSEGWDLFYLGYPVKQADKNLFPIVRSGIISAHDLPTPHTIMIDALAAAGNSGGPCFLKPIPFSIGKAKPIPKKTPFIGILKQTFELGFLVGERSSFYVAGLSMVVSGDAILSLFNREDYQDHLNTFQEKKIRFKTSLQGIGLVLN